MNSNNFGEENAKVVVAFLLPVTGVVSLSLIIVGLSTIIMKKPMLPGYRYANMPPESMGRLALYSGSGLLLAGIGMASFVLWSIGVFWNAGWLAWIRTWYALALCLALVSIGITVALLAIIRFNGRLFAWNFHGNEDGNKRSNK